MDAGYLAQFPYFDLAVPVWQMSMYVGIVSICMLVNADKLALIVTYLFTLYWGYFTVWGEVLKSIGSFPTTGTWFLILGGLHVVLTLIAFFRGS